MAWLLKLKHWQLFLLVMVPPFLCQIAFLALGILNREPPPAWMMALLLITGCGIFLWVYAIGTNLYKNLPASVTLSLPLFKIAVIYPLVYFGLFGVFFAATFDMSKPSVSPFLFLAFLVVPFHLAAMASMVYMLFFAAKVLKSVELSKPATFAEFAGEFFLMWFFPVGVWFIQPRLNQMVS